MSGTEQNAESESLVAALCREYHPMHWDVTYGNRDKPCEACKRHGARLISAGWRFVQPGEEVDELPNCEGWMCLSCGADNFIPGGFGRVTRPEASADR